MVAQEVVAKQGERAVVEGMVRVGGRVDEAAGQRLDAEARGQREAGVQGVESGGGGGCLGRRGGQVRVVRPQRLEAGVLFIFVILRFLDGGCGGAGL